MHVSRVPGVSQESQLTGCGAQDDETRPVVLDESTHDEVDKVPIKILFLFRSSPAMFLFLADGTSRHLLLLV